MVFDLDPWHWYLTLSCDLDLWTYSWGIHPLRSNINWSYPTLLLIINTSISVLVIYCNIVLKNVSISSVFTHTLKYYIVVAMITISRCRWLGRSRKSWIHGWNRGCRASWTPAPRPCSISVALQHRPWSGPYTFLCQLYRRVYFASPWFHTALGPFIHINATSTCPNLHAS